MTRTTEPEPNSTQPPPADWAAAFYARGWRGRLPWVVVEQLWPYSDRADGYFQQTGGGWGFGQVSCRVLDAPMFNVFATPEIAHAIIEAIRAYPVHRATFFELIERPAYQAQGLPASLIERIAPRPDLPLNDSLLFSPILLVRSPAGASGYVLLGAASTFDAILESLVAHSEIQVDQAMELLILLTCHGRPGDVAYVTRNDGSHVLRRGDLDSAFLKPFHPDRFEQVKAALHVRTAGDSRVEREAELNRVLASQIRPVVEHLRRKPPRKGSSVHEAARSRLAERASTALGLARKTRPRAKAIPWYAALDASSERDQRAFLRSLSVEERRVLRAVRRGERLPNRPSTPRVLLARAKAKWVKALRDRFQTPT